MPPLCHLKFDKIQFHLSHTLKRSVNNCIRGELPLEGGVIRDIYNFFFHMLAESSKTRTFRLSHRVLLFFSYNPVTYSRKPLTEEPRIKSGIVRSYPYWSVALRIVTVINRSSPCISVAILDNF
jgi:hypothetical protein